MKQRLIESVGRTARLRVLNELKRTPSGLPVGELAGRLGMSYMGVKDVCVDLEKRGLLDTWRQPQKIGRPQMLYRLTLKAHELYPTASNAFTIDLLEAAQKLFGPAAAEKLLLIAFQKKTEEYAAKITEDSPWERAAALARLREREGCMAEVQGNPEGEWAIVEHHSPILDVLRAFPVVARLEEEMFRRLLEVAVQREESGVSGLYCVTFRFTPGSRF